MFSILSVFYLHDSNLWFCRFSTEEKKKSWYFFFPQWVFHWGVGYYLELCYCFSLVQEFLWHICLYFYFPCGSTWGDSTLAVFYKQLWWFFSLSFEDYQSLLSHCHMQQGAVWFKKDHVHSSVSPPRFLLARDLTRQETAQQTSCPGKLFKKKFNSGLVSCDLAVEWIRNSSK